MKWVLAPILQVKELKCREGKQPARGHTASSKGAEVQAQLGRFRSSRFQPWH